MYNELKYTESEKIQSTGYTQSSSKVNENKYANEAIKARYDAQRRFFGMSKMQQTMAKLNGQYKKYTQLWNQANGELTPEKEHEISEKLGKMFR